MDFGLQPSREDERTVEVVDRSPEPPLQPSEPPLPPSKPPPPPSLVSSRRDLEPRNVYGHLISMSSKELGRKKAIWGVSLNIFFLVFLFFINVTILLWLVVAFDDATEYDFSVSYV